MGTEVDNEWGIYPKGKHLLAEIFGGQDEESA